jgi:hypothetical protein
MTCSLLLAIAPTSRGFGYITFAERLPADWGVKEIRSNKNVEALAKIEDMLRRIVPKILVLEDPSHRSCRRSPRVRWLLKDAALLAGRAQVAVALYSRQDLRLIFSGKGKSKDAIAAAIAEELPALRPWLPRKRRIWESEHHSMAIFEAAALALAYYSALTAPVAQHPDQLSLL